MAEMTERERDVLKLQQGLEQLAEIMRTTIAPFVAAYYRGLIAQGLPEAAATMLATSVQEALIAPLFPGNQDRL